MEWRCWITKLKEIGLTANDEVLKKLIGHYDILNKDELFNGIGTGRIITR